MKNSLKRQGMLLTLALLVSVCAMSYGPGESSGKKGDQKPPTAETAQSTKPGIIPKPGEAPKQGDVDTVDLGGGVKLELVWVPAGSFQMGSPDSESGRQSGEGPVHTVELDGFWMGKYEVTQEQYQAVIGKNPSTSNFKGAKNPVDGVSWNDATDFCRKASQKTGKGIRLPTEAEWEYACRAGSSTRFCFGDSDSGLGDYAWHGRNSGGKTHPVGEKKANAWGLYDMHGNVWEWCEDWYDKDYYGISPRKNPKGPSSGGSRVLRGGGGDTRPWGCRSAFRSGLAPTASRSYVGFRVVLFSSQTAKSEGIAKPGIIAKPGEAPKQGDVDTVDLGGGVKMELVFVPEDSGEGGFWAGKYEVTQEQYEAVMGKNPSEFKGPKNPVEQVSWNDATDFCRRLTDKVGRASSPAKSFRLPAEAEWEYACRAGTTTRFCFGDSDGGLADYAWYDGNSGKQTHPVGGKKPNAWGLYDMHGNVSEWCGEKDSQGPSSGEYRVLRGGSWIYDPSFCPSAARLRDILSYTYSYYGFRVVRVGESSGKKGDQKPPTAETAQSTKPGIIPKPSDAPKQGDVDTVNLGGGVKMELVWVPAGSFQMGSPQSEQDQAVKDGTPKGWASGEGPVHTVELDGFWMGKYEVTQEQYQAVMGKNPSNFKGAKNPVDSVFWNDATEFCRKASQKTGKAIRLPTEAEWEYACRAGSSTRFCFGDSDNGLGEYAWYGGNSGKTTHPVGEKKANEWGLYDMHGNVWEWCEDWYGEDYYGISPRKNPKGPSSGGSRVLRGGGWLIFPWDCRSALRIGDTPSFTWLILGFRVVVFSSSP